jgi:hypothetical protein
MDERQFAREINALNQGVGKPFFDELSKQPIFTLNDMAKEQIKTPEELMKEGFESFFKARECFEKAALEYDKVTGYDTLNAENVRAAIHFLAKAYDQVSEIWENDINI